MTTKGMMVAAVCLVAPLALAGCGGKKTSAVSPTVPGVTIVVDTSRLPADRVAAWNEEGGTKALTDAVATELLDEKKQLAAGPAELRLVVTSFRLRSSGSAMWLGVMAGADVLDVEATVVSGGATVKTFSTGAGTAMGGAMSGGRFDKLVETTSERLVAGL